MRWWTYEFISSMVSTFLASSTLYVAVFLFTEKPYQSLVDVSKFGSLRLTNSLIDVVGSLGSSSLGLLVTLVLADL